MTNAKFAISRRADGSDTLSPFSADLSTNSEAPTCTVQAPHPCIYGRASTRPGRASVTAVPFHTSAPFTHTR